jgi:hypothetical protein
MNTGLGDPPEYSIGNSGLVLTILDVQAAEDAIIIKAMK